MSLTRATEKLAADLRRVPPAHSIMANKAQPPHLHLAEVTASQFLDIWKHFDADGEAVFVLVVSFCIGVNC